MQILGLSASRREWGNTDILVRHALKGARQEGAQTRFLRLTDFKIEQCRECLACLFKERDCMLPDQLGELLAVLRRADGVVLGSPIHILFAAGALQNLVPRLFGLGYSGELTGKPGLALAVGGRPGWEGWALPQVMIFFLSLGMPIVDQFTGYGQGPGEIFFDTAACRRALEGGAAMARGETGFRGEPGACPSCHYGPVITDGEGRPRCTLCNVPGRWKKKAEKIQFEPLPGAKSRWDTMENRKHFEEGILPSMYGFQERREEIRKKLQEFKRN